MRKIKVSLLILVLIFLCTSSLAKVPNAIASELSTISSASLPLPTDRSLLETARKQVGANWTLENGYTGKGVSVAVLDDGAQTDHEQFRGRIIEEVCFNYQNNRGYYECRNGKTFDIGLGAADYIVQENGKYLSGTRHGTNAISTVLEFAPDAKIIVIKAGDPESAYKWILENAKKYNIAAFSMSYGSLWARNLPIPSYSGLCVQTEIESDIFQKLWAIGVVPVASSANQGQFEQIDYPACSPWVVSAGSIEVGKNIISNFSNVSNRLSLLAPAGFETANVTEDPNIKNAYFKFGGTSQSAPLIAALFAIGKSINPSASIDELRGIARLTSNSADDKISKDNKIINFEKFVRRLLDPQSGFRNLKSKTLEKESLRIYWQTLPGAETYELVIDRSRVIKLSGNEREYLLSGLRPNYTGMAELIAFDKTGNKIWQEEEFIQSLPYKGIDSVRVIKNGDNLNIKWRNLKSSEKIQLFINGYPVKELFNPTTEGLEISSTGPLGKIRLIKINSLNKSGYLIDSEQLGGSWKESNSNFDYSGNSVEVNFSKSGKPNFSVKIKP